MRRTFAWGATCALMLLAGCTESPGGDDPDAAPAPDTAVDGHTPDTAEPAPDAAPDARSDTAPPEDRCPAACQRLTACAIEQCDGIGGDDGPAVEAACLTLCAETPPLANVLLGADGCGTVVDFGSDRLDQLAGDACGGGMSVEPDPLPTDIPCPWECEAGERCLGGYCVRDDGTCDTDYHCRPDREVCGDDGRCQPAQFAPCRGVADCAEGFECRYFDPDPFANGTCIRPCGGDADCPFGEGCNVAFGNLCYPIVCGPGTGNGALYRDCAVVDAPGTCYPLSLGQQRQGTPGICVEGGTAEVGAECDSQAEERTEESAALRCVPGALCFGDPDNPLDPNGSRDGRGECTNLCDPRDPGATCGEGETCLDYSQPDDPTTQFDETQYIGVCYRFECDIFDAESRCAEGERCALVGVEYSGGVCAPDGQAGVGEPCEAYEDCAGNAICGGNGRGEQVCVAACRPDAEGACPEDQSCYTEEGWAMGFCIYAPPDGGVDMGPEDMGPEDMGPEMDMASEDMGVE